MDFQPVRDLSDRWLSEAESYARDGALVRAEALLHRVADELTEALDEWWLAELTIEEVAEEKGQSYDTIQRRVATGRLHNVGRKHRPRVRRADLYEAAGQDEDRLKEIATEMLTL